MHFGFFFLVNSVHVVAKALTEVDEKASIALSLVLWKNHDA